MLSSTCSSRVIGALLDQVDKLNAQKETDSSSVMHSVSVERARVLDNSLAALGLDNCSEADCLFLIQRIEDRKDMAKFSADASMKQPQQTAQPHATASTPIKELFSLLRIGRTLLSDDDHSTTLIFLDFVRSFRQTGMLKIWEQLHQILETDQNQELTLDEFERGCTMLASSADPLHTRYGSNVTEICAYIQRCYEEECVAQAESREIDTGIELSKTDHYDSKLKALFMVLGIDGTNFSKIRLVMGIQQFFDQEDSSFEAFSKGVYAWANKELPLRDRSGSVTGPDILDACRKIQHQYDELKAAGKLPQMSSPRHGIELGVRKDYNAAT